VTKKFKAIKGKKRRQAFAKSNAPKRPGRKEREEAAKQELIRRMDLGLELVTKWNQRFAEYPIPVKERAALEDVINSALDTDGAAFAAVGKNCRFCVMAAYQLGRSGNVPDCLPGEMMATVLGTIKDIPIEDQQNNMNIAASLTATAISKEVDRPSSARAHLWCAFLLGQERGRIDRGAS
jgi:hypothetical protein